MIAPARAIERFWQRVDRSGGPQACWLWLAGSSTDGYGRTRVGFRTDYAHRAAYVLLVGAIPAGLHLDHLCRVPRCVNPAHLEPVTPAENIRRGLGGPRARCLRGHAYDEANTRTVNGQRWCRACGVARTTAGRRLRQLEGSAA